MFCQSSVSLKINLNLDTLLSLYITEGMSDKLNVLHVQLPFFVDPAEVVYFYITNHNISENQTSSVNGKFVGNPTPLVSVTNNDSGYMLLMPNPLVGFSMNFLGQCNEDGTYILNGYNKHNTKNFTRSDHLSVLCKWRSLYLEWIVFLPC